MSELQSAGMKRYWSKKSKKEKAERGRIAVTGRWAKTTKKQRRAIALKMVDAKRKKMSK